MNAARPKSSEKQQELELLRESALSFCSREAPAERIKSLRENSRGYSRELFQAFSELGWMGILLDEETGGLGLDLNAFAAIAIQAGKQAMPEPLIETGALSAIVINGLYPHNNLARSLANQIAEAGRIIITAAENFRDGGMDKLPIAFREGEQLKISGELAAVPHADSADLLLLPVALDNEFALVCLSPDEDGLDLAVRQLADGTTHAHITINDLLTPAENLVGQGSEAHHIFAFAVERYQLLNAAFLLGLMSECFEITMEYLRTRVQFDQPIGSFQALQHRAVEMFIQRELCEAVINETIAAAETTKNLGELRLLASRAQNRAIEAATLITREAIQMHGAIGFTYECNIGHYLNRALVLAARMGNGAWHRRRVEALASDFDAGEETLDIAKVTNTSPSDWNDISDEDFRTIIRDWFEKEYPEAMRYPSRRFRWSEIKDWYLKLSDKGWVAPAWPREHGGMGLSPSKMLIFMEEQERWGIGRAPDMGILMIGPLLLSSCLKLSTITSHE